jgi:hypothetical protein
VALNAPGGSGGGQDRKKELSADPVFALATVDLLELDKSTFHIAPYLPSIRCEPPPPHAPTPNPLLPMPEAAETL